ncbi:MAG: flagellar filament capping protein FliD [Rhodoferax sp.]|nr:flagellar filament capping protein FliD [Rhodoferax sp.]
MATISSAGIGSGLDVNSIVTQLVALEKQPLKALESKATVVQAQISAFAEIQSQFSALSDVTTRIADSTAWAARSASSSNTSAATISVTSAAAATSFTLDVDVLAKKQSTSSPATITTGAYVGAGTLTFRLGTWTGATTDAGADNTALAAAEASATSALTADNTAAAALTALAVGTPTVNNYAVAYNAWTAAIAANDHVTPALQTVESDALATLNSEYALLAPADQASVDALPEVIAAAATDASTLKGTAIAARSSFTAASGSSDVTVSVEATDTVATLAAKINAASAGVVATAFNDGTYDRLLLSAKDTGKAAGFKVTATDTVANGGGVLTSGDNLSRLAYDPSSGAFGMASSGIPASYGGDALARINVLAVTSGSNTLDSNIPGVTINLVATTTPTTQVTLSVSEDVTLAVKNVSDFVTAYNTLSASLADLTKYDAATKTASLFQGDSAMLGLQSVLRSMLGSTSTGSSVYSRLSDVGVQLQRDGSLTLNTTKLSAAANNGTELQKMFTTNNSNTLTNGFGIKFRDLARGVLATGGSVVNKATALQNALTRNAAEQTKVNDRAASFEARLRKQYSALDVRMAGLTALNAYVAQQVTTWNKSTA